MRQFLFSSVLLITLTAHSQPPNPSKKEKIKALFTLMHQDSLMIKTFDAMAASMVKNMSALFNDTAYNNQGVDVSALTQKLMVRMMQRSKELALKVLNEDLVAIYDQYFTGEEVQDFANFYASPSGQKLLNQTPAITRDLMAVMGAKYQKDFQQSFSKDVEEITNEITEQSRAKHN